MFDTALVEDPRNRFATLRSGREQIAAQSLHERIPFAIGSMTEVTLYERFLRGERPS